MFEACGQGVGGGGTAWNSAQSCTEPVFRKPICAKNTDFKTDSFSRLFTALLIGLFRRLPVFETDLSTIKWHRNFFLMC
jgi:hypothetical protein